MKLFTIGDSISQGFMSLAAARTELSFSTLIARSMGMHPGMRDYPLPSWGAGGLPMNIESLFRLLQRKYGSDVRGPIEWVRAVGTINDYLDEIETFYERGPGNIAMPQAGDTQSFPNVSVAGFTVADAWTVTPRLCLERIVNDTKGAGDGFFALPNMSFERTAHAVLNPSRDPAFDDHSQLEWLRHHHEREGVENVVLWLGSNNALGTIVRMEAKSTATAEKSPLDMSLDERNEYNLWTPEHFEEEYEELLSRVHAILSKGKTPTRVFIATVPPVTVAPLARGVGGETALPDPFGILDQSVYFDAYTYFLFDLSYARRSGNALSRDVVVGIDRTIAAYNESIRKLVKAYNGQKPKAGGKAVEYVVVDIAAQLLNLAFKRNGGHPPYELPPELKAINASTGRPVNTVYYNVDRQGTMTSGGVFSLDGVHPTAIGHGLIAREFMAAMAKAGVTGLAPLNWPAIVASDSLYTNPISLIPEFYDNTRLAGIILDLLRLP